MQPLLSTLIFFINSIFPRECIGCRKNNELLCFGCVENIPRAPDSEHSFINAIFDYRNPVIRRAIWKFKYKNSRALAEAFAPYMYDEILLAIGNELFISGGENIMLVPIPLHKKRLRERGYNQSELLMREILKLDSAGIFSYEPNLLIRSRETKPQAKSEKRNARIKNLRGAFSATDTKRAHGRIAILIDDVTTTGATLVEAKRALATIHPRKVLAFAVAH